MKGKQTKLNEKKIEENKIMLKNLFFSVDQDNIKTQLEEVKVA